ncbi:MAG: type II toxin-antitoxin system VapC family toxin [Candidatus Omnitrophica bacterium]|nr:type II toxin-antitoxin system VapC family toxin [Candidatus Omnitrophota bacterium]
MRTFLLDTNIWEYWFNKESHPEKYSNIEHQIRELESLEKSSNEFAWRLGISFVTLGEIDYGYNVMTKKERSREHEFRAFINSKKPWIPQIDKHVAKEYGKLRAGLFETYAPKNKKRKGLRPEQLIDPVTSLKLGIQENDLWIAAQAVSRNLTLITNDKMDRISKVAGKSLHIDNWAINRK